MKEITRSGRVAALILATVFIGAAGACKKNASSNSAAALEQGFKSSSADIKAFAQQAIDAEAKNDFNTAFRHYRALSLNQDLSPEQRNLAQNSMLEMTKHLNQAATNGDAEAAMNMQMYRMSR